MSFMKLVTRPLDGVYPPGTLEAQQQEYARRIRRITEERANEKLRTSLLIREHRVRAAAEPKLQQLTAPPANQKESTASNNVAVLSNTSSKKFFVKKKSSLVASSPKNILKIPPNPIKKKFYGTTISKVKVKTTNSSSSIRLTGQNLETKKDYRTQTKPRLTNTQSNSQSSNLKNQLKSSVMRLSTVSLRENGSKESSNKVRFAGVTTNKSFYCPLTTPVSILKNRKKIESLTKSSLKPSTESKDNLLRANQSKDNNNSSVDLPLETRIFFKFSHLQRTNLAPQPNIPICKAFPGTKEWDNYWTNFGVVMEKYNKDMADFERNGAEAFAEDISLYKKENQKAQAQKELFNKLGAKGVELGLVPPPPLESRELKGLQWLNGYLVKSKNLKGTVSTVPGSTSGVRFEIDIRGTEAENILVQRDHNIFTLSIEEEKFIRIGMPRGKEAKEIEIWNIDGILIIDAP